MLTQRNGELYLKFNDNLIPFTVKDDKYAINIWIDNGINLDITAPSIPAILAVTEKLKGVSY